MSTPAPAFYPDPARMALERLGSRLRLARTNRRLRQQDLAQKIGRSRATVIEIEKGSGKVEIEAYIAALSALGLLDALDLVADPTLDRDAQALVYSATERRVRLKKRLDNDF
ncbi:MAG TPA: helix-turn-helix transcriptional regulator [Usitatibacter sp.]|nr:helix-turn-helix transcriptional regulator [Usitatibacter sp.]